MTVIRTTTASLTTAAALATTAALVTTAALPGGAALAAGAPAGYAFAEDARRIDGANSTPDAQPLDPGATYRSSLPRNGTLYYRLELDAASDAHVAVTAVPGAAGEVTAVDGVRVSVQDADGAACSSDSATFGAARSPRPVTAWGLREIDPGGSRCQDPGTYYVTVERTRPEDSPPDAWDLEITAVTEPRPEQPGETTAPESWDSASPEPPAGEPERRPGGSGFAHATPVGQGAWRDDIRPGQTLFYKVPLDWGRQVYATAELDGSGDRSGYATGALRLALHNPVRGEVDDAAKGYTGRPATVALSPLPPVGYANRYDTDGQVAAMRFAGAYYLVVHLAAQAADDFGQGPFGLTLRVRLGGASQAGPEYAGESRPEGVFEVSAADRAAAPEAAGATDDDLALKALAVGGIGTGSALLLGLGVWTAAARRSRGA
ncbi:hypothetical protein ACFUVV_07700 [Streptomyces sp. NPDC057376]|uniref:hypothetical protein n=1 Tax=unclassified Streptomyces TaxID=2593676 RepID=UPI00093DE3B7|nr:hypothetical protein [Streptomyces sp. CB02414]OKI86813.1 hypothetical protein AMK11_11805 [Streptomyces sp. CB02414]